MAVQPLGEERLTSVFRPHRPVEFPDALEGRKVLLRRAMDAVDTSGLHIILFGDRGIGKTSIARVLAYLTQEADRPSGRRALLASCTSDDDFSSIWYKVFQEVWLAERQLGLIQQSVAQITGRMQLDAPISSPNDVRLVVQSLPHPYVIIIDEFDRVPLDNDARRLMADTIKMFSDYALESTIVVLGVAESIGELIAEHSSIARNTAQLHVEPLEFEELALIISKGFSRLSMELEAGVDMRIAGLSQGYPSYTHLLGLWAGRYANDLGEMKVTHDHLNAAIPLALENVMGGVIQEYEKAVDSAQPGNLFREVLLACALASKDSVGRFTAAAVREPLRTITGQPYDIGAYQSHLAKFCQDDRGPTLRKTGRRHHYRWQFVNPQIIPYIRLKGVQHGLIGG